MRPRHCWTLALAALVLPAPARADVEAEVAAAPAAIEVGSTRAVTYTVTVRNTGTAQERFAFRAPSVPFADGEGAAMEPEADLVTEGVTRLGPGTATTGDPPACLHGLGTTERAWDVAVEPGATGTLRLGYTVSTRPRWPGTAYRPRFTLASHLVDGARGTLAADRRAEAPDARVGGRRGVRITLTTDPATAAPGDRDVTRVDAGEAIDVRGRTTPALRHALVTIVVDPEGARARTVRARTDGRGRYAVRGLALDRRGSTLVSARSHRRGALRGDFTCPLAFDVG